MSYPPKLPRRASTTMQGVEPIQNEMEAAGVEPAHHVRPALLASLRAPLLPGCPDNAPGARDGDHLPSNEIYLTLENEPWRSLEAAQYAVYASSAESNLPNTVLLLNALIWARHFPREDSHETPLYPLAFLADFFAFCEFCAIEHTRRLHFRLSKVFPLT